MTAVHSSMFSQQDDAPRMTGYRSSAATAVISAMLISGVAIRLFAADVQPDEGGIFEPLFEHEREASVQSGEIEDLLNQLRSKVAELDDREAGIAKMEASLRESKEKIISQVAALKEAESNLRKELGKAKEAASADVETVARLYESMKPDQASEVFEMMEPSLAAGLLVKMTPENASRILAKVTPEKSYAIGVYISGRNAE